MVEELFPAFVAVMVQVDVDERIVHGLDGFFNKLHACDFRSLASFFDVAFGTGTDDVFPCCFAAHTSRDDVVER